MTNTDRQEGATEHDSDGIDVVYDFREEWRKRTWLGKMELVSVSTVLVLIFSPALIAEGVGRVIRTVWNPIVRRLPPKYKEEYQDGA